MKLPIFKVILLICTWKASNAKLICDIEEYVRTGMEFIQCQSKTLKSFHEYKKDPEGIQKVHAANPCPALKKIIDSCVNVVRHCYDERGFVRGRQVFLELLALDYPDHNHCGVFKGRNTSKAEVESKKVPDELCTIDEEVALLKTLGNCATSAQSNFLSSLMKHPSAPSRSVERDEEVAVYYYPAVCDGLQKISDDCYVGQLGQCYTAQEQEYHLAFLLEDLKVTGITISSHLILAAKPDGNETLVVDVDDCPMFKLGYLYASSSSSSVVVAMGIIVAFLILAIVAVLGTFLMKQFRILPKIRARLIERTPYEDIVITEQSPTSPSASVDTSNLEACQRIHEGNATLASLSQDLAARHRKGNEAIVNSFSNPDEEFGSTSQST